MRYELVAFLPRNEPYKVIRKARRAGNVPLFVRLLAAEYREVSLIFDQRGPIAPVGLQLVLDQ